MLNGNKHHKHQMKLIRVYIDTYTKRKYYSFQCVNIDGDFCPYHYKFIHSISTRNFWRTKR